VNSLPSHSDAVIKKHTHPIGDLLSHATRLQFGCFTDLQLHWLEGGESINLAKEYKLFLIVQFLD